MNPERLRMNWDGIMIHHSLTKDSDSVSWGAIRRYHVATMGWQDIGYHAGIELVDSEYEILFGRRWDIPGAHCKEGNGNERFLGFCFVGNFDETVPSQMMMEIAVKRFVKPMFELNICKRFIVTHNQYASYKSCPGILFPTEVFRKMCLT